MDPRLFDDPPLHEGPSTPTQFTSVARLVHQHHNMERLLSLVERAADAIGGGQSPDYPVVLAALHYLTEYIDRFHHPAEDAAFTLLRRRHAQTRDVVVPLCLEHDELTFHGRQLRALLGGALDDHAVRRETAERASRDYVAALRRHMRWEEQYAFPLLDQHMRPSDWQHIDQVLSTRPDPLFGPTVEDRYQELFRQLGIEAECSCAFA